MYQNSRGEEWGEWWDRQTDAAEIIYITVLFIYHVSAASRHDVSRMAVVSDRKIEGQVLFSRSFGPAIK